MKKELALKVVGELMEPFEIIELHYNDDEWDIIVSDSVFYSKEATQLMAIAKKFNLEFSVEGEGIIISEKEAKSC